MGRHRPSLPGWKVTAWGATPKGTFLAGLGSNWFGASIHRSADLAEWEQVVDGPSYPEGGARKLEQIWTLAAAGERLYAGVAQAGLFSSDDDGLTWQPVEALNDYPGHEGWLPGAGGLAAHHVLADGDRLWVAISAVGVFRSADGGQSFSRRDQGVTPVSDEEEGSEPAYCVHGIVADPARPDRIWRQDHRGVYRTLDGGDRWERIENGLPAGFGFPVLRDHASGRLFVAPLESDENRVPVGGRFSAYASDDDGDSWHVAGRGWPESPTFTGVLRGAAHASGDGQVFLGTTAGTVWWTNDAGATWSMLPFTFPRILAVRRMEST